MSLCTVFFSFRVCKRRRLFTLSHFKLCQMGTMRSDWQPVQQSHCRMSGMKSVCMFISNALSDLFWALLCWSSFLVIFEGIVYCWRDCWVFRNSIRPYYNFYRMQYTVYSMQRKPLLPKYARYNLHGILYPTMHLMNLIWRMSQKLFQLIFNISCFGWTVNTKDILYWIKNAK